MYWRNGANNCLPWAKASAAQLRKYEELLSDNLFSVKSPVDKLLCRDPMCLNDNRNADINDLAGSINSACINAAKAALPKETNRAASKRIPGWSEYVQPHCEGGHSSGIKCGQTVGMREMER